MKFANASQSFLRLNPHLDDTGTPPKLERSAGDGALETPQTKGGNQGRVFVRVTSIRKRLLDPDNLCEKYHLDCCRYAGLLRDDTAAEISLKTDQRKARKGEEEHIEIEIMELPQ